MSDLDHEPPHDFNAERTVLASVLLVNECVFDISGILRPQHFYSDVHSLIYSCILRMHESCEKIDAVGVAEFFERQDQLSDIGGIPFLIELLDARDESTLRVKSCAELVRNCWMERNLDLPSDLFEVMRWPVPFGKFQGCPVMDVSIRYLEETVYDMRPSFFTRMVRRLLDAREICSRLITVSNSGNFPYETTIAGALEDWINRNDGY